MCWRFQCYVNKVTYLTSTASNFLLGDDMRDTAIIFDPLKQLSLNNVILNMIFTLFSTSFINLFNT